MVSFRLSSVEYAAAEKRCSEQGVRSVSTLARDATLKLARVERLNASADTEMLLQLQHQVLWLRTELDKLTGLLPRA